MPKWERGEVSLDLQSEDVAYQLKCVPSIIRNNN